MFIPFIFTLQALSQPKQPLFEEVIAHVENDYLWTEDIQARRGLIKAAERLEALIPWLLVDTTADHLILKHGDNTEFARLPFPTYFRDLEGSLETLQGLIIREERKGYEVSDEIDLELELLYGLTQALDAYTVLLFSDKLKNFNERINGKLSGIGCRVRRHPEGLEILEIFPDGPAARGMLKEGDLIISVDGGSLRGLSTEQGVNRLRGDSGTPVQIEYVQNWAEEHEKENFDIQQLQHKQVQLVRSTVRIPNVHWQIQNDIGIITIENFSQQTNRFLYEALEEFEQNNIRGIIMDLRDNSGGSMLQACRLLDRFLEDGLILRTSGRDGKAPDRLMKDYVAKKSDNDIDLPLVLLINEDSASASEIVAGTLQLHERALLIGEKTYGKGVIQLPFRLRTDTDDDIEDVTLKMTVAQYLLKDDFSVHESNGVVPDIWLTPFYLHSNGIYISDQAQGLIYALEKEGWEEKTSGKSDNISNSIQQRDFVLEFALQILQVPNRTVADLRDYAKKLQIEEQKKEWEFISKELQEKKNIDWQGAPFVIEGPTPILENPPFDVFLSVVGAPIAGEDVDIHVRITNNSKKPLYRSRVHLHADDRKIPWDDIVIPIGFVPPKSTKVYMKRVSIPNYLESRVDPVYVTTFVEGMGQSLSKEMTFEIHQIEKPKFAIDTDVLNIEEDIWQLDLILHNYGKTKLEDLSLQLLIPNAKTVEFLSGDILEQKEVPPQSKITHQFRFRFPKREDAEDGLYDESFVMKIDASSMSRKQNFEVPLDDLVRGHFEPPSIELTLPTRSLVGSLPLDIHLEDDGNIVQSRVWVDGEKQYWTKNVDYSTNIELTTGQHHIIVIAEDNQGIETRIDKYIYVESMDR